MKLKPDNPKIRVIQFFNKEQDGEYRRATNGECMSIDKLRYLQIEIGRHCTLMEILGIEPMVG
jgi:hypothetical protein